MIKIDWHKLFIDIIGEPLRHHVIFGFWVQLATRINMVEGTATHHYELRWTWKWYLADGGRAVAWHRCFKFA